MVRKMMNIRTYVQQPFDKPEGDKQQDQGALVESLMNRQANDEH